VERLEAAALSDFVTEQRNPGNSKGVSRIVVELPARRLSEGIVFVDTPGLGSLAASGAAETRAYLPQCDLGVVLIDAGSALSDEDLATIQALCEAGVPACVLLSKADLLAQPDRESALAYIAEQIRQHLGLTLAVWQVSILGEPTASLDAWFEERIAPLYEHHQQLVDESVRRKIAALRESVEAALRSKLDRVAGIRSLDAEALRHVEKDLRRTAGRVPEETSACLRAIDEMEKLAPAALREAVSRIIERWRQGQNVETGIVTAAVLKTAAGAANQLYVRLDGLARELTGALQQAAQQLDVTEIPQEQELVLALREMPQLDFGGERVKLKRSPFVSVAKPLVQARLEARLRRLLGREVSEAFRSYRRLLDAWVHRAIAAMQARFDSHADTYRAQLDRLLGSFEASPEATEAIRRVRSDLPVHLEQTIGEHCAELQDRLAGQIGEALTVPEPFGAADRLRDLTERADSIAGDNLRQWLSMRQPEILEALWNAAAQPMDLLERFENEALGLAAELFGLPPPVAVWRFCKEEAPFSWTAAVPFGWHPRFPWELDLLPAGWVRGRVRREYVRTLAVAGAAYRNRVAHALSDSGAAWVDRLGSEIQQGLRNLGTQIESAIRGEGASAISAKAGVLLGRLEAMHVELANASGLAKPAPMASGERRAIRPCFLCERIRADLFDFFSKQQYELSVDEAQQHAHAANGGFCPLHTWQYERLASPQGVCLAYAPLLASMALRLRSIASSESSPRSMRDRVLELSPPAGTCPACQRVAEAERIAIGQWRQIAAHETDPAEGGLCLVHLGAVLECETDTETARRLILDQAIVLDRISEDMQTYSLKHDAVRRELASDEEWVAHMLGLARLVGDRRLSSA
ncbi:MAG: hypothetical protein ABSG25_05800, partial [Bryobacteraceae bacterium]